MCDGDWEEERIGLTCPRPAPSVSSNLSSPDPVVSPTLSRPARVTDKWRILYVTIENCVTLFQHVPQIDRVLIRMTCSYVWHAHTYDMLIRMTCSYVWRAHTYDVLTRMTCSYIWRAHTYDVLIHMTCSYVRRNKMTGSIGACVRRWRFSKANNLTSMQNFSDVQQISCTLHNYLYDDVEKHEIPRMELDLCSFEIFWKYPLTCSRLFLRSGEILVPSRSGDRPSCCSTSITSSTSPRCGRDNSSRWRHSSSYRKYTNLAPCTQNEANWNRQWNEMWSTRTVSTTICSTGPLTVTDGSVTYTTPNDRSIQLDAILFNLGSIQPYLHHYTNTIHYK